MIKMVYYSVDVRLRGSLSGVRILIRGMIYFCMITHSLDVKEIHQMMNIHQQNDSIENKLCIMPHKSTAVA